MKRGRFEVSSRDIYGYRKIIDFGTMDRRGGDCHFRLDDADIDDLTTLLSEVRKTDSNSNFNDLSMTYYTAYVQLVQRNVTSNIEREDDVTIAGIDKRLKLVEDVLMARNEVRRAADRPVIADEVVVADPRRVC